jgi:hypothetical protein
VLLPDDFDANKFYRALYVLPVIEWDHRRYGDGLLEAKKHGYLNSHQLVCVALEFKVKP